MKEEDGGMEGVGALKEEVHQEGTKVLQKKVSLWIIRQVNKLINLTFV
jgi:hypothetical protein